MSRHERSENTIPLPLQYMPSNRLGDIDFTGEVSLTKQSEADACDINKIMGQFERTGLLPHVMQYGGRYEDLGDATTYHDAMNAVVSAQEAFESLPANIRSRFGNDPAAFLDFVNDDANRDEMARMGLLDLPEGGVAQPTLSAAQPPSVAPEGPGSSSPKGE